MKNLSVIILAILFSATGSFAQNADYDLNILMSPPSVALNTTGTLNVSSCNNGSTQIVANSLRITISAGINAEIIGIAAGSDLRYTVLSLTTGSNNTIQLKNTNGTISEITGADPCANINLTIKATAVGGPSNITGTIGYISANNSLIGGAPNSSQGNLTTANDNSATSLTVTPAILPVKLSSFNAYSAGCNADISWNSETEINFKNYKVEYSTDGERYAEVYAVAGKGNNASYKFTHNAAAGKAFYRIKSVDLDNRIDYTRSIGINISCEKNTVSVYPNPASDVLHINIGHTTAGNTNSMLFDAHGRKVMSQLLQFGINKINISRLAKGVYSLSLQTNNSIENKQVVIQ